MKQLSKQAPAADPWMLAEDIPDMDVFFAQIWQSCFVNEFVRPGGRRYKKILNIQRGNHLWFYFGEHDSNEVGEHLAARIVGNPAWGAEVNRKIVYWADRLRRFAETVPEDHLDELSNSALWNVYQKHDAVHTAYYQWCWIPVAADMFHDNLTNRVRNYLETRCDERMINESLVTLTQPRQKSLIQIEQEEFLQIARDIYRNTRQRRIFRRLFTTFQEQQAAPLGLKTHTPEYEQVLEERAAHIKDDILRSIMKRIERHYRKYYYVKFMWIGKADVDTFDHYLTELVKLIGNGVNPTVEYRRMQTDFKRQQRNRTALMKRLKIEPRWGRVFDVWGDFMVTKIYRRYAQIYAIYRMQPVLKEIAARIGVSDYEIRFMLKKEIHAALMRGKINRRAVHARTKLAVYSYSRNEEWVFTGSRARSLVAQTRRTVDRSTRSILGQVGCVGRARGTVRLIIRPSDMLKMRRGDILVSIATDPDIVPAMKKAAAIVTEQGGVTSHAAIVSREMNIPCVIGTKIATKVFKDGDRVEVDATKGVVKKI